MSQLIKVTQNDTGPNLVLTFTDKASGAILDLTGATFAMKWRAKNTTLLLTITGMTLTILGAPTNGQATLIWGSTALVNPPGYYELEIIITQGGQQVTVPTPTQVLLQPAF